MAQVRRASAAMPWRMVRFTRSIKAVFSRPEKPILCKLARISVLSAKAHHRCDACQLATPVAFLHLTVDQLLCHLPPACFQASTDYFKPLSVFGDETAAGTITMKQRGIDWLLEDIQHTAGIYRFLLY